MLETTRADVDDPAFRPFYAAFFPVWLLVIYGGARALAGRAAAGWTTLAAALLPVPLSRRRAAPSPLTATCRWPVSTAAVSCSCSRPGCARRRGWRRESCWRRRPSPRPKARSSPSWRSSSAASTPYARLAAGGRPRSPRPGGAAARARLILLFAWRAGIPERFESYEKIVSWSLLWPGILTRAPRLATYAGAQMGDSGSWGYFWWVAPLVLIAGWRGLRRRVALPLLLPWPCLWASPGSPTRSA